jgi:hypothetical protein
MKLCDFSLLPHALQMNEMRRNEDAIKTKSWYHKKSPLVTIDFL